MDNTRARPLEIERVVANAALPKLRSYGQGFADKKV